MYIYISIQYSSYARYVYVCAKWLHVHVYMFVSAHHLAKRACRAAFACDFRGANVHDLHAAKLSRNT